MSEISVEQLAADTGYTVSAIGQAIKRGYLPEGRKEGKTRLMPEVESKLILMSKKPGAHWVQKRPRPGKRKDKPATAGLTLEQLQQINANFQAGEAQPGDNVQLLDPEGAAEVLIAAGLLSWSDVL